MARFFKPLLGAVALAAATLTSTGAMAQSYAYNAQITITAPKGSTAELASKDKTKPTGIKLTTCAAKITAITPNIPNIDALNFSIKYDAGKSADQIGDVYLLLENLAETPTAPTQRYIAVARPAGGGLLGLADGGIVLYPATDAATLHGLDSTAAPPTIAPFLAATDNLGAGAQTEVLFGGSLNLTGLDKGLWAMHLIIAKPGTSHHANTALTASSFSFGHPETWAAYDTAVFALGTPLALDETALAPNTTGLVEYNSTGVATDASNVAAKTSCE